MINRRFTVVVDAPIALRPSIEWTLAHVGRDLGIDMRASYLPSLHSDSTPVDAWYAESPPGTGVRWWPFNPRCYRGDGSFRGTKTGGRVLWSEGETNPDLLGGVYRLMTLVDEASVRPNDRNHLGIFTTSALEEQRRALVDHPLVEHHIDALWDRVRDIRPELTRMPRWPDGKRWACVLTHDTDAVGLGTSRELAYNAAKLILRRDGVRLGMISAGLRHRRSPTLDPFFGFPIWQGLENQWGMRSAFYVFVQPEGVRRHLHDSRSAVTDHSSYAPILRGLADAGWEFGLHASIHTREHPEGFRRGREALEGLLGRPISGLRHHYWALDWQSPWRTLRQHAAAGFRYDSSIGWRDAPGFRAGTSLPYRPFDPERGEPIDLWELPCGIMDGHISDWSDPEPALDRSLRIADRVRATGGALVLNWHTEGASNRFDRSGHVDMLERLLQRIRHHSDAWLATPDQLVSHWEKRASAVQTDVRNPRLATGP